MTGCPANGANEMLWVRTVARSYRRTSVFGRWSLMRMDTEPVDTSTFITPVSRPEKPAVPVIAPANAVNKPLPAPVGDGVPSAGSAPEPTKTRIPSSDAARRRGEVVEMVINLDAGRIALLTRDGPPYRGYVDTDLAPGAYWLTPQPRTHRWAFQSSAVKTGLRFTLWIDGPDPFSLTYANPMLLVAGSGVDNPKIDGLSTLAKAVSRLIADSTEDAHFQAVALLCQFSATDLYDIVDTLWTQAPEVVNALLLRMTGSFKGKDLEGLSEVIRALESFARRPEEIYIDGFSRWIVHPDSFKTNEDRQRAGLSNIQLLLEFDLFPPRAVVIYLDDINDTTRTDTELPRYGPSNLTYPRFLTKSATPRLYQAKNDALMQIGAQNAEFFVASFKAVAVVLLSVFQASGSIAKLYSAKPTRVPTSGRSGPGRWQATFEAGSNMSEAAERYELTSCGTPPGMGYYVEGVQFEGFANGRLLDAKFWHSGGTIGRAVIRQSFWAGWKVINQAERQLAVARLHGVGVEWRVAEAEVADALRAMFQANRLPINVVHIAP
ncbi:hypothetical protein PX699_29515 [Sphingobium sp. H39-3-25]|uniref:hypothetical protein n=1 Tax=Sphingobium arseniciresistens TaxID=3030834 RepID=UPI0023B8FFA3|nr:hypothetical protein [Sphingobium arseniciresistens]